MRGEWATFSLGELCDFRAGSVFKPALQGQSSGRFPFIKVSDMNLPANSVRIQDANNWVSEDSLRELGAKPCPPGTVVFAKIGEALRQNRLRQVARETIIDNNMMGAVPRSDLIDPRFFYYALSQFDFSDIAQGTALPYLTISSLSALPLKVPPTTNEQRAIAHILGTLDDKIELNRQMNETLEAQAQALFKSWFVDFAPVGAKAEGKDTGLPKHLADIFPDHLADSELGEIPAGWEVKKLSELCSTQYGYTASAVDEPVGPKLLRVTDINKQNWIEWSDVPYCQIDADERASYTLQVGDLVVARMADPGKSAMIEEQIDAVFASYLVRLKTISLAHSYYIYGFLKSDLYTEYAEGARGGSVQANMNARVIVSASLVVPPTIAIEQFFQVILPLRQRLVANVRESRTLAALRDTLLPKLISGELRVKDAERFIKEKGL